MTTIEGYGIGNKKGLLVFAFFAFVILVLPIDPESKNIIFRNESANFALKITTFIIFLLTASVVFFGNKKILITPSGFYICFLWKKTLISWAGCSAFGVKTNVLQKGIMMKDEIDEWVSFSNSSNLLYTRLTLPNISNRVLCGLMNKYCDQYRKED